MHQCKTVQSAISVKRRCKYFPAGEYNCSSSGVSIVSQVSAVSACSSSVRANSSPCFPFSEKSSIPWMLLNQSMSQCIPWQTESYVLTGKYRSGFLACSSLRYELSCVFCALQTLYIPMTFLHLQFKFSNLFKFL